VTRPPEKLVHGAAGAAGYLFGVLSGAALAVAAFIPALLGLLAFVLSPLRSLMRRLRGGS
jgi:hypothetical protein